MEALRRYEIMNMREFIRELSIGFLWMSRKGEKNRRPKIRGSKYKKDIPVPKQKAPVIKFPKSGNIFRTVFME